MSEITDQDLASIYSSLSSCSPLVRGLAERLRRAEGEIRQHRIQAQSASAKARWARHYLVEVNTICESSPELNMSNYDVDQVATLNQSMIEATLLLREALKEVAHTDCPQCENTALRERMKRMEEALQEITKHTEVDDYFLVDVPSHASQIAQAALKEGGE